MLTGEVDRRDHIGYIHTAGDQRGSLLNHAVVDPASLLIASIAGTQQRAPQARCKLLKRRFLLRDARSLLFSHTFLLVYTVV